jgi:hypothetical protein
MADGERNTALQQALIERARREQTRRQEAPDRTLMQTIYENVIGSGAADTPGERFGQLIRGGFAGAARGIADVPALPVNIAQLGAMGVERALGMEQPSLVSRGLEALPETRNMLAAIPIIGPESQYVAPGTAGQFASTIGEFAGGAGAMAGPRAIGRYGVAPGATSEAAGQLTEGTAAEPYARVAGAFFGPMVAQTTNRTVNAMFRRASDRPSLETLQDAKRAAYQAVDTAGIKVPTTVTDDIIARADAAASSANYVPDVDVQTRAALQILNNQAGKELTISELDKLRQGLWTRYNRAPNEVAIRDMIDIIDDAIQTAPGGGDLMNAARLANTRFKKAELLENAFRRAEDQVAATGSGGNTVNKFRQSIVSIINNPKQAKFFSQEEIDFMRQFARGDLPENTMRLIGKLSPSGNGLMAALNIGAAGASSGATLPITALGAGAKAMSEASARRGAEALRTMAATGQIPLRDPALTGRGVAAMLPGLLAQ